MLVVEVLMISWPLLFDVKKINEWSWSIKLLLSNLLSYLFSFLPFLPKRPTHYSYQLCNEPTSLSKLLTYVLSTLKEFKFVLSLITFCLDHKIQIQNSGTYVEFWNSIILQDSDPTIWIVEKPEYWSNHSQNRLVHL